MPAIVLDGKAYAKELEAELATRVARLNLQDPPILATILVGGRPASATYVRMKANACRRVGMESLSITLPNATTTAELLAAIDDLNANPASAASSSSIPSPNRSTSAPASTASLSRKTSTASPPTASAAMAMDEPAYGSATPAGIMRLFRRYQIPVEGPRSRCRRTPAPSSAAPWP